LNVRWLVNLYPRRWRERYGEEFVALIDRGTVGWSGTLDIVRAAARERVLVHGRMPALLFMTFGFLPGAVLIAASLLMLTTAFAFQLHSAFGALALPAAAVRILWALISIVVMFYMFYSFKRATSNAAILRLGSAAFAAAVLMKWASETWLHPLSTADMDRWTAFGRGDVLIFGGLILDLWIRLADPRIKAILATYPTGKSA